jgi:hypothetical protein
VELTPKYKKGDIVRYNLQSIRPEHQDFFENRPLTIIGAITKDMPVVMYTFWYHDDDKQIKSAFSQETDLELQIQEIRKRKLKHIL